MVDVLSEKQRQYNMSRIRGYNTKPEMLIRQGLHARGFRFRLHVRELPGRPDLVFRRYGVAVFVNGCFWHGHDCDRFRWPKTRERFWRDKIQKNRKRDATSVAALRRQGWRVLTVWECALRGPGQLDLDDLLTACATFLRDSDILQLEIRSCDQSELEA